ncbi:MAG: seg [Candidatus Nomurabacteria bacterium]|nr:seg [Candidatus Nomurabacteria bacterium]
MQEETKIDYNNLVAKKSEKLVTALYLVTDLMTDNEAIKHALRKNAVTLLSSMNTLSQMDVKDRIKEFKVSLKTVTEITSLLHVSITTGIVSEMNGKLLMDGFRALQLALEKRQPILTKEMLHIEGEENLNKEESFSSAVTSTSYDVITPLSLVRLHSSEKDLRETEEALKHSRLLSKFDNIKDNKRQEYNNMSDRQDHKRDTHPQKESTHSLLMQHASKTDASLASSFQMRKQSRRDQILALFIKGVDISIKDISSRIKGCSEKTIQRELNALLEDNVIDRIGEKRWSRYVLK